MSLVVRHGTCAMNFRWKARVVVVVFWRWARGKRSCPGVRRRIPFIALHQARGHGCEKCLDEMRPGIVLIDDGSDEKQNVRVGMNKCPPGMDVNVGAYYLRHFVHQKKV